MVRAGYAALAIAACVAAVAGILLGVFSTPSTLPHIRALGRFILYSTFNVFMKGWWAGSPEAVTATLWDYRGIDTVFETTVLYVAVAGCVALAYAGLRRGEDLREGPDEGGGLTVVVKAATKILFALILLTSLNVALHGYITPGGGFAGGSTFAIAPLLIIAAYSTNAIISRGFKFRRSAVLRSLGLLGLAAVILTPLAYYGYVLQNQVKAASSFPGYPAFLGPIFLGGSLICLNMAEFLVVGMEYVLVFIAFYFLDKVLRR